MTRSVLGALFGAAVVATVELCALGSARPALLLSVLSLLAGLGLACGLAMGLAELAVSRLSLAPLPAALVRAAPALLPLGFAARHLFEGGSARSLPGADWGHLWVPLVGYAILATTLWLAHLALSRRPGLRPLAAAALTALVVAAELANRRLFRSEYADLHAFLIVVTVVATGLAGSLAWSWRHPRPTAGPWPRRVAIGAAAAIALGLVPVLEFGLASKSDRALVATRGCHARHLARVNRQWLDLDGDGYAAVLGGGDCDDHDGAVNPAAIDLPGNGRDEDCDGADAVPPPPAPATAAGYDQLLAGWLAGPEASGLLARTRDDSIVLILVDALRADLLEPTEANRRDYPRMFELIDQSVGYRRAFSPSAGTDVSVSGLLTGRYDPFVVIDTTLTEGMEATGRAVHAVLPREVLRWAGEVLLTRGLTSLDRLITDRVKRDVGSESTSAETSRLGLAFLDRAPERFFLWLHYLDVHEHNQIEDNDARLRAVLGDDPHPDRVTKYYATARLVDAAVGEILDGLHARGRWDHTIVILCADHGESLGEDPRLPDTHGRYVYNPLVHVPLFIRIPGVAPATIDRPVSLLDLTPTLFQLAGAPVPSGLDGHTLLPDLAGGAPAALADQTFPILIHESNQYGIIVWPYKLLHRPAENLTELYDLERDFAERDDLAEALPERVRELTGRYKTFPPMTIDRTRAALKKRNQLAKPPRSGPGSG